MDQVGEILSHHSLEEGEFYLLDAGVIRDPLKGGENESVEWPVLILSRLNSTENTVHERFRPGNPQRPGDNYKLVITHDSFQKPSPEQMGNYNGARYYRITEQERETFRSIRFLFLSYIPDDAIFESVQEQVQNAAS